jgi:hypothetical protein
VIDELCDHHNPILNPPPHDQEEAQGQPLKRGLLGNIWFVFRLEAPIWCILILCAALIGFQEGWTIFGSIYWLVITGTTVGFGDYTPTVQSMRALCVLFIPLSVAVVGELLARIASIYLDDKTAEAEARFLRKSLTLCDIETMDVDKDGKVDRAEFLSYMLVALQKCSREDIEEINTLFHRLDVSKDGCLARDDLRTSGWCESFRRSLSGSRGMSLSARDYEELNRLASLPESEADSAHMSEPD